MKKSTIITLVISSVLMSSYAMEPQKPATPTSGYHKPLPPVPAKKPATSALQTNPQPFVANNNSSNSATVKLTYDQEKSVQRIIKAINKVMENSVSITKNSINLGKTASLSNIVSNTKEATSIVAKLGVSSALIADIYLNVEKLSEATPEAKAIARRKILAILDSADFKASQAELIKLAADDSLPAVVHIPLQKFATQLVELPGLIVKKYLGQEHLKQELILEAK